jgi:hypothetical protein
MPRILRFRRFLRGDAISEASTHTLTLSRRRTELALDWSGKLEFERKLRHPTRDEMPCLRAKLESPEERPLAPFVTNALNEEEAW